ncbi:hypothetical protein [Streptomyces sp. NPDC088748]|uniref:hypothetical protein n=1 Tax=Streptomyces sp. NPDC088748 TaxID=3365887 RepID=UPI0038294040
MDTEPDGFEKNGAGGCQAFDEGGRGACRILACAGTAHALTLLDVGWARRAQVADRAADPMRGGVTQPGRFEELRARFGETDTECGFRL